MKKVVCCAAVVFGMMEVSQGMEIENSKEEEKVLAVEEILKEIEAAAQKPIFLPKEIECFVIKNGKICNVNDEEDVLYFDDVKEVDKKEENEKNWE